MKTTEQIEVVVSWRIAAYITEGEFDSIEDAYTRIYEHTADDFVAEVMNRESVHDNIVNLATAFIKMNQDLLDDFMEGFMRRINITAETVKSN